MSDIHTKPTPEYGTEIPEEPPTQPALPAAHIRCYMCLGERMVLTVTERDADGNILKRLASPCTECVGPDGKPTGTISRDKFARWHAARQGRP